MNKIMLIATRPRSETRVSAAVDGGDPLPANSCIFVGPEDPAFAGASGLVGAELLCLQFRRRARD
jgi:hypothetical protein